jgi:hypothetical protein
MRRCDFTGLTAAAFATAVSGHAQQGPRAPPAVGGDKRPITQTSEFVGRILATSRQARRSRCGIGVPAFRHDPGQRAGLRLEGASRKIK